MLVVSIKLYVDRRDERRSEWADKYTKEDRRNTKEKQRSDSVSSEDGSKKSKQGELITIYHKPLRRVLIKSKKLVFTCKFYCV